jgi:hypothetical protein
MERMTAADYRALVARPPVEKLPIKPPKRARKLKIKGLDDKPKGPPTFLASISRLMARAPLSNLRLKPEEQLAVEFANTLRQATLEGRLSAVWTHPANEIAGRRDKLAMIRYAIAKAMGLIDGTADYLFLWKTGSGAMEAKVGKNGQQTNQVDFQCWCEKMGVPYRTFTSVDEGMAILREWGVLA